MITGFTIIIPVHEGIHAIVYKMLGAKNIRFGADVKKMIFYATADKYVTTRKKFIIKLFIFTFNFNLTLFFKLVQSNRIIDRIIND